MDTTDMWEEVGLETLEGFGKPRQLVIRAMEKSFQQFAKNNLKGVDSLLEIGSGTGFLQSAWPYYDWSWTQLEPQTAFIEEARGKNPHGTYVNGSVYDIPFPDQSFDAVCGFGSFDCFSDLKTAVGEALRVLKPGGIFFHMLDIGADYLTIQKELEKKRIPTSIMGRSNTPSIGGKNANLRYIPEERLDHFLLEAGLTRSEMDDLPNVTVDSIFGLYSRKKKLPEPESSDSESIKELFAQVNLHQEYFDLFEKHSVIVDANSYFSEKLSRTLNAHTDVEVVKTDPMTGRYIGRREQCHRDIHESAFYFNRTATTFDVGGYRLSLGFVLYDKLKEKHPFLANKFEPRYSEISVIDCVVARCKRL